ncbi:hypothetical protein CN941_25880 [Bacillus cereus]|nr:hypothetical protein CN941_25880 [Bacillus cereus]
MVQGKIQPVVCVKKFDDGSESIIRRFATYKEAVKWSKENNIMCEGALQWTLKNNTYLTKPKNHRAKYHNRDLYRFAKIQNFHENT